MLKVIDCDYLFQKFAASYLLIEKNEAVFVETNTNSAVPRLLEELKQSGLTPEQVKYIIITHVHLDHAGGASLLMSLCPNATLLAHPRAIKHMIDPTKLVGSARAVYGAERFAALYGEIAPIAADRVRAMQDGEVLQWGSRSLEFFETRGHANHHFCIYDSKTRGIFTGDSFGVMYPQVQHDGLLVFPSTSPTDFDAAEAHRTIDKVLSRNPEQVFLTHFGPFSQIQEIARSLRYWIDESQALLDRAILWPQTGADLAHRCTEQLTEKMREFTQARGIRLSAEDWKLLALDLEINGDGIAWVVEKRRSES